MYRLMMMMPQMMPVMLRQWDRRILLLTSTAVRVRPSADTGRKQTLVSRVHGCSVSATLSVSTFYVSSVTMGIKVLFYCKIWQKLRSRLRRSHVIHWSLKLIAENLVQERDHNNYHNLAPNENGKINVGWMNSTDRRRWRRRVRAASRRARRRRTRRRWRTCCQEAAQPRE